MANLTVIVTHKIPHWRIRAVKAAVFFLEPFIRNEKTGERICDVLLAFIHRGSRLYLNGERIS